MTLREFVQQREFRQGKYEVSALLHKGQQLVPLLTFQIPAADEQDARHVPEVQVAAQLGEHDLGLVLCALVRAGVQHPGLRDEELVRLHRVVREHRHVELFTDLNALTTGLLGHLVRSLGTGVSRVVISSSSIDILHEYQAMVRRGDEEARRFLKRAEMARALRILDEIRRTVPVHVHQLSPGSTRYFQRGRAQPFEKEESPSVDERTYISEDRQMISAYWDYVSRSNPRLPIHLITSDFNLAHVCFAERVPYLFARSPYEAWKAPSTLSLEALWFDPFAMALRACLPHSVLWELCLVYGNLNVVQVDTPEESALRFSLSYDVRDHLPGQIESMESGPPHNPVSAGADRKAARGKQTGPPPSAERSKMDRKVKVKLSTLAEVLPRQPGQSIPLGAFQARDDDSLRQLRQIGEVTGLWQVKDNLVTSGPALSELLEALKTSDYVAVNRLFRRYPAYDKMLQEVESGEPFPNHKQGGALTGWAVCLGAAYKGKDSTRYGLAEMSREDFAGVVARTHAELAQEGASVALPLLMDQVCRRSRLSPIRFEGLLENVLGKGTLQGYEAQRATVQEDIPEHLVLVAPAADTPDSYWRTFTPGNGLRLGGTLMGTLVRRPGEA
ncbi:hypothetical protein POL68_29005 [Stigmatella sp. ncwal1]|uniref:Uncharacterized protein n=1 Tax=Stigmatella ashevillensis TaxID=2995309 RepID=A0ABT5DFW3_9BACT|nr:hypothetical protein [Stigmatella ashevillena]MDC0712537.1 hypothetical protein [Stigmatella ashevillena]